jgi:hypothetical protein
MIKLRPLRWGICLGSFRKAQCHLTGPYEGEAVTRDMMMAPDSGVSEEGGHVPRNKGDLQNTEKGQATDPAWLCPGRKQP